MSDVDKLRALKRKIMSETWCDASAKQSVLTGIDLCIAKLECGE